ncbi:MAG: hypothetical protein R2771_02565 [Saprospiraceae bacterium]
MKSILFLIFTILYLNFILNAQNSCLVIDNSGGTFSSPVTTTDVGEMKYVIVNIHFIQKSDGTGNFTEDDDGFGNPYTGYNVAFDVLDWMNLRSNEHLNIPPNNQLETLPYNVKFIIDAIYFHQSDTYYPNSYSSSCDNQFQINPDNILQIYYRGNGSAGDYANTVSTTNLDRYTCISTLETRYATYIYNITHNIYDEFGWFMHPAAQTTMHELYHLLALSHTVRQPGGICCSAYPSSSSCGNDYCSDTPSYYEMINNYGYNPTGNGEPCCGWTNCSDIWCSNNLMDYCGAGALSPCQLERVHTALDNGLKSFRLCDKLNSPLTIGSFGYPQVSYYGSVVTISNSSNVPTVPSSNVSHVYASDEIVFHEFEVMDGGTFEVFFHNGCQ